MPVEGGVVFEGEFQAVVLADQEAHVELRGPVVQLVHGELDVRGLRPVGAPAAQRGELDLEERVAQRVAHRADGLDHLLEGQLAVGEGVHDGGRGAGDQLAEGELVGDLGPQGDHLDEAADDLLQVGVRPGGARRAHDDVLAAGPVPQQRVEGGEQGGEDGGAVGVGELGEAVQQFLVQGQLQTAAVAAGLGAARVVGEDLGGDGAGQDLAPLGGERPAVLVVLQLGPLPGREVGVLDGEPGGLGALARGGRRVAGGQFLGEDPGRARVPGDVVDDPEQDVAVLGEPHEVGADGRAGGEVEGGGGAARGELGELAVRVLAARQVGALDAEHEGGDGFLPGDSVDLDEFAVQHLVAGDDGVERLVQGGPVEGAAQAYGQGYVVAGLAGAELVDEPHLLLLEGGAGPRPVVGALQFDAAAHAGRHLVAHPSQQPGALSLGQTAEPFGEIRHGFLRCGAGRRGERRAGRAGAWRSSGGPRGSRRGVRRPRTGPRRGSRSRSPRSPRRRRR